jgi:hypothetical protein
MLYFVNNKNQVGVYNDFTLIAPSSSMLIIKIVSDFVRRHFRNCQPRARFARCAAGDYNAFPNFSEPSNSFHFEVLCC